MFKNDSIVSEVTETESVVSLIAYKDSKFAYALSNGTLGMYEKLHRLWRVKVSATSKKVFAYSEGMITKKEYNFLFLKIRRVISLTPSEIYSDHDNSLWVILKIGADTAAPSITSLMRKMGF